MKKPFKLEISKTVLSIMISGIFTLFTISAGTIYNTNRTLIDKYTTRLDVIQDQEFNLINFIKNIEDTENVPKLSFKRIKILMDSLNFDRVEIPTKEKILKYLKISADSRLDIKNSIGLVDSQINIDGKYASNINLNQSLKNLLEAEKQTWFAVDNYLLNIDQNNWRENEILFKQIDYNLLNYQECQNRHATIFSKMLMIKDNFTRKKDRENDIFDTSIEELIFIRRINIIGLLISVIILFPLISITIKTYKKR